MKFDDLVNELLEQNTLDESLMQKIGKFATGATMAASLLGGSAQAADSTPAETAAKEKARRYQVADLLAKGKSVSELPPKYAENDQSPEAKAYRIRMKKIEAAEKFAKGK
jgi:hypothetical protein